MGHVSPVPAAADGTRWMGVGRSDESDSHRAGAEATRRALQGADPKLLIVFGAVGHDSTALVAGVGEAAPGVPVIGGSTNGEIAPDGPRDGTVVVTALGGAGFAVATCADEAISGRQRDAGVAVARCAAEVPDLEYKVLFLLTDGYARSQENILRGAYSVVGASVPLVGGSAGAPIVERCYQIHNGRILKDSVVAAAIASHAPIGIGMSHGWHKVGPAMVVTSSDNARVYTLDNEPALDKYLRQLDAPEAVYHDAAAFTDWAMTRPVGVQRRSGLAVRAIAHDIDFAGRSIGGGSEMVQGALIWATQGDAGSILDATETATRQAVDALGDHPPIGLLTMSCLGCKVVLGDEGIQQETARIAGEAKGAPFAGFHTHGEICRTRGVEGFHNQTLVVMALS